eukprot:2996174-Pyramimonas_sp.AAC.1
MPSGPTPLFLPSAAKAAAVRTAPASRDTGGGAGSAPQRNWSRETSSPWNTDAKCSSHLAVSSSGDVVSEPSSLYTEVFWM